MIQKIRDCFESDEILYTRHAKFEMETEEFEPVVIRNMGKLSETGGNRNNYFNQKEKLCGN